MNLENVDVILDQLIQKTLEGKLNWEKTSKAGSYKSSLKKGFFSIESISNRFFTQNSNPTYHKFSIYDDKGDEIFERSTGNINSSLAQLERLMNSNLNSASLHDSINNKIASLFNSVEDANGSKLRDIFNELSGL